MNTSDHFRADRSALLLILSNLVTIFLAVVQQWNVQDLMWIYWGQSIIIGVFNWRRILDLKQFSTEGFRVNDQPVEPTRRTQVQTAWFFLFHYGFFHIGYLVFLMSEKKPDAVTPVFGIAVCILAFLVNHAFSYRHNRQRDMDRAPNIGTIMFFPYARIIPMHLTILFGSHFVRDSSGRLLLFLGLKTLADVIMHMVEHADARRKKSFQK